MVFHHEEPDPNYGQVERTDQVAEYNLHEDTDSDMESDQFENNEFNEGYEWSGRFAASDASLDYIKFRAVMFLNGPLIRVQNRLDMKQSLMSNVYRETSTGLKAMPSFHNECLDILEINGITKVSIQKQYTERLARDILIEDELNKDTEYLIATPSGEVIDLNALYKIKKDGKNPEEYAEEWRKHISMFQEHRITLRSGVDYNSSISPEVGFNIIGDLVRLMVSCPNEWVLDNTKQWLIGFLGRLLIGGNAYKEFVSLLGEKDSGKTTLVGILKDIMGSYCGVVKDEILQGSDTDSINRSLYVLKDKRLLVHSEGTNQKKVNTVTLKRITGDSLIPLGNQDYSFTIKGKIVEDTNYAPVPDNPTDEAFNKRAIIIPFQKNTTVNKATIDNIINQAKDNKEAIFVAMVHAATFGMGDAQKVNPWVSEQVKNCLSILRDLETVFYKNICETNLTDNVTVLGSRLHKAFQEWIDKCIIPALRMMPYLSSEKIEFPSEREFHDKMKKLHTSYDTHSREGLRYRKLFVHEDRIYWDSRLFWKETNPLLDIKRNEAREAEKNRKMMESFNNKEVLNDKLESSISRDNNAVQGINKHSPKQARDAQMAMRPFQMPPFNMGAGMWPLPFPLNAPLYPQMPQEGSPGPLFKPKRPNPPNIPPEPTEGPVKPSNEDAEGTQNLNISDKEYDRIMKEVRRDPRYCRIVTLEELENAPENMHFGGKMIQFPDRVEIVPDDELRDRCFDTTIDHEEEPESSQK